MTDSRVSSGRYSIGEWYGLGLERMSDAERQMFAKRELKAGGLTNSPCPFQESADCNKIGGVCSLRQYFKTEKETCEGVDSPVTTCPNRFLEGGMIFAWVAETLLDTTDPVVLSEIGFLKRLSTGEDEEENSATIGRIDNVLVHPTKTPIDWCAVEIQAVYFSGKSMNAEFKQIAKGGFSGIPYPKERRRPDWRSSGPKRLLPQLQTKTPTIRTWGKKVAVVVDEPFFDSMVGLEAEKHPSNAEIVWFVVRYVPTERGWTIMPGSVVYTKLESSVKALTGGVPVSIQEFESQLLSKIRKNDPSHPLLPN